MSKTKRNMCGTPSRFSVELQLHPDSSCSISQCYGKFRFWVAGVPYGRDELDASALASSYESLREHQKSFISDVPTWIEGQSPRELLQKVYWLIYEVTDDELERKLAVPEEVDDARRAVIAPDGDEAFDDGSFVAYWKNRDEIVIAAGKITTNATTGITLIGEPFTSVVITRAEFYQTIEQAIGVFQKLE